MAKKIKQFSTEEKIQKLIQWKQDPASFFEECLYLPLGGKDTLIKLHDCQKKVLEDFYKNHNLIILKSRQTGFSTLFTCICCHIVLYFNNIEIGVLSKSGAAASSFNRKVIKMLEKFQSDFPWAFPGFITVNQQSFELKNGSKVISSAISPSSPDSAFRGNSLTVLILDEAAYIQRIDNVWTGVAPALSNAQMVAKERGIPWGTIVLSTPNGKSGVGAWYYRQWTRAIANPTGMWKPHRVHWNEIPAYVNDKNWYNIQCELLEWNQARIDQELELKFVSSEGSLWPSSIQSYLNEVKNENTSKMRLGDGDLWIFKKEIDASKFYLIGVDTASSSGTDYSVIQVMDYVTMEQVMEYRCKTEPLLFARVLKRIVKMVPCNKIIVENTGGYGAPVLNDLMFDTENNFNIYGGWKKNRFDPKTKPRKYIYGLSTNVQTRPLILESLYNCIIEDISRIKSERLALELLSLSNKEAKIEADAGFNDDLAMAFGFCCYVRKYCPDVFINKGVDENKMAKFNAVMGPEYVDGFINEMYEDGRVKTSTSFIDSYNKIKNEAIEAITHKSEHYNKNDDNFIDYFEPDDANQEESFTAEDMETYDRIFGN